jgi:23S rRNA (pseudouridine1915-N3)-methyltransferase
MRTEVFAIGKLRPAYRSLADDYLRRLRRYGPVEERELRESARAPTTTQRRREETARIEAALPPHATVVALEQGGSLWSSEELARRLDQWRGAAAPVALVIGGAFGLEPAGPMSTSQV